MFMEACGEKLKNSYNIKNRNSETLSFCRQYCGVIVNDLTKKLAKYFLLHTLLSFLLAILHNDLTIICENIKLFVNILKNLSSVDLVIKIQTTAMLFVLKQNCKTITYVVQN